MPIPARPDRDDLPTRPADAPLPPRPELDDTSQHNLADLWIDLGGGD